MKQVASSFVRYAFGAAFTAAALAGSLSPGLAQSSAPFAGLEGVWAGNGTVELSDGTNERIRCRATYAVAKGGQGLQQTLRCASDSYKFDLSSNVESQGGRVSGSWSEASRGINGNVQGRAGDGQVNVLVEAAGFAANLTVATRGNKQSVNISSKGEIKAVNITMTRG